MYILEGNIGAGKSTFLQMIKEQMPDLSVKLEAVDVWQSPLHGQSLLTEFYINPLRWAYTFENFTMVSRIQEYRAAQAVTNTLIIERSIYSGHFVFARNSFESGFMTPLEWNVYQQWFNFLTHSLSLPQGFIYLRVDPDISLSRVKKRKRGAEDSLSYDYLVQIYEKHEEFLFKRSGDSSLLKEVPVLILDGNRDFESDKNYFYKQCDLLIEFLRA